MIDWWMKYHNTPNDWGAVAVILLVAILATAMLMTDWEKYDNGHPRL